MERFKIALLQISPCGSLEGNLEKGIKICRQAKKMAAATCNYPEKVPDCNGRSTVFDGVAYLPDEEESRDTCILEADGSEGIYIAELDLKQLRDYRKSEVHGNAYRHPQKYGILTEMKVEEPFIREDYRR
mgnify:FL=1